MTSNKNVVEFEKFLNLSGYLIEFAGWASLISFLIVNYFELYDFLNIFIIPIWFLVFLTSIFFIFSGRYFRHVHGRFTPKLLLASGVISVITLLGSMLLGFGSFCLYTYSKYKKLDKRSQKVVTTPNPKTRLIPRFLKVVLVILIVIGSLQIINVANQRTITIHPLPGLASKTEPYRAESDNFLVTFPAGTLKITKNNLTKSEKEVNRVNYTLSNDNNDILYGVVVDNVGPYNPDEIKSQLDKYVNQDSKESGGKDLSKEFISLSGQDAIDSHDINDSSRSVYARTVYRDGKMYDIVTNGATQKQFESFANSFSFIK